MSSPWFWYFKKRGKKRKRKRKTEKKKKIVDCKVFLSMAAGPRLGLGKACGPDPAHKKGSWPNLETGPGPGEPWPSDAGERSVAGSVSPRAGFRFGAATDLRCYDVVVRRHRSSSRVVGLMRFGAGCRSSPRVAKIRCGVGISRPLTLGFPFGHRPDDFGRC